MEGSPAAVGVIIALMRAHLVLGLACMGCGFEHGRLGMRDDGGQADGPRDADDRASDVSIDVPPQCPSGTGTTPQVRVEAEAFSNSTTVGAHAWTVRTDQPCFTGTGFIEVLPDDSTLQCSGTLDIISCGPRADFAVTVPAAGEYHFHARMMSLDSGEDSIFWGIDNVVVGNYINQDENPIPMWKWQVGALPLQLTAGAHVVRIWMREDGARVDAIALSTSPESPP